MRRDSASHVFRYAFGNGFERFVVTRRAQICQICLSERLVAAFQLIRERNVFDLAFLVISQRSISYSLEGFRTTGAEVEDAGNAIFRGTTGLHLPHRQHRRSRV